jgi:hypothetical protein
MRDDTLVEGVAEAVTAVHRALEGLDDWGLAGTRDGQYRSDLLADRAAVAVLDAAGLGVLSEESGLHHGDRAHRRVRRGADMIEHPRELGGGEVGVDHQPGDLADTALMPGLSQPGAVRRCAPVLPDDGAREGLERATVPDDEGLALVGDSDRAHIARPGAGGCEGLTGCSLNRRPDLLGVVLDPTGLRIVLGDLAVPLAPDLSIESDCDGSRAGRALVEAEHDPAISH